MSGENRIQRRFEKLKGEGRAAFMTYVMAGDPSLEATAKVLEGLPAAGVDLIELGVPFTDPMADGPAIQIAGQRALANGVTLAKVLGLVEGFRQKDAETPIILMGYYNPIYAMGVDRFLAAAKEAGVDGLIIVDLPREEDAELCIPAREMGIDFVRLATPTTDDRRLPAILQNTSGFVYYVSITGVTGAAAADASRIAPEIQRIKAQTDLPIVVGFGVRTPEIAEEVGRIADGVVVGTAVVKLLSEEKPVDEVLAFVASLAEGVRRAAR